MKKKVSVVFKLLLCLGCAALIVVLTRYQQTSAKRPKDEYERKIEQLHSSIDKDEDGTDDQEDILENALAYVAQQPKYKSKYYETGYPDDEYGVCTDVVASAMKNSGYDLMKLVEKDIEEHPSEYDLEKPDINIDFRRVKNLRVFFEHKAESLTTDITDIKAWQGGDIVVFKNHIGIVSDRRNKAGIPYIIHHDDPWQTSYEQDILETRDDLIGHYRMSE